MSEGIKGVSVATAAVANNENGDRDFKDSSVEQQAVSSDSVIYKDSSIAEVEISSFFFRKSMSQKNNSIVPRLDSL